jgi:type I restriction enzyme S subunit
MTEYPPDWDVAELGSIGLWMSGGTPSTSSPVYWDGHIPWISATSLKSFDIRESERKVTELGANSGTRRVPAGTVIFVVRGMSLKTEFRVGVTSREVTFGQDCKAIRTPVGVNSRFLAYALKANEDEILSMVDEAGHGTGRLPTKQLAQLRIGLPQEIEQEQILEVLDSADESIRSTERLIGKLEQVKRASFQDFLFGTSRASVQCTVRRLGEIASISGGVTLGKNLVGPGTIELPYLRVANVKDGFIDTSDLRNVRILETEVDRYGLRAGDVLMTEGGDFDKLGRGAVWDGRIAACLHQNHIFRVRCDVRQILPDFLSIYSGSPFGRRWFVNVSKQTTNLASISLTQLQSFPVPCPAVADQDSIVRYLSVVQARLKGCLDEVAKLRAARQGLMDDLLTGHVRVNAADDTNM